MQVRHVLSVVALGCMLMIGPLVFAASQHVAEAILHAQAAVLQGQQGYPDELVKHLLGRAATAPSRSPQRCL